MPQEYIHPPSVCNLCNAPITHEFVDGKTKYGCWANMCLSCYLREGVGIGVGLGRRYTRVGTRFFKQEG